MAWRKSPPELIALFEKIAPDAPIGQRRKMFGYPCCFANQNLFIGLHQENMILRLPEADRQVFLEQYKASLFEPMPGRPMREYVIVPDVLLKDEKVLGDWITKSLNYVLSLPPKATKARKKKSDLS